MKGYTPIDASTGLPSATTDESLLKTKWVNGNPSTGTVGAIVAAEAIAHPMIEILNFIKGSGLTPDENNLSQMVKALAEHLVNYGVLKADGSGGYVVDDDNTYSPPNGETVLTSGNYNQNIPFLEINSSGTGDRPAFIDFHASGAPRSLDYSARIFRGDGVDGDLDFINMGSGTVRIKGVDVDNYARKDINIPQDFAGAISANNGNIISNSIAGNNPNYWFRVDGINKAALFLEPNSNYLRFQKHNNTDSSIVESYLTITDDDITFSDLTSGLTISLKDARGIGFNPSPTITKIVNNGTNVGGKSVNTPYQNTTDYNMLITINPAYTEGAGIQVGVTTGTLSTVGFQAGGGISALVPPGYWYKITQPGGAIIYWTEWS